VPLSLHAYVWPFIIIWPVFFRYYLSQDLYDKHIGGQEWTFVWCGTIITIQSLVWLSTNWSVNLRSLFTSTSVKSVGEAKLIKVLPIANAGAPDICSIVRDTVCLSFPFSRITLTFSRLEAKTMFHFSSKKDDSFTTRRKAPFHHLLTRSTPSQNRDSNNSKSRTAFLHNLSFRESSSTMATIHLISRFLPSSSSLKSMRSRHFSFSRSFV
jgi:hypothetical protein